MWKVFKRLEEYGLKVNFDKVDFLTESVKFLGIEIGAEKWSLKEYLNKKSQSFGEIKHWKDLERLIDVFSVIFLLPRSHRNRSLESSAKRGYPACCPLQSVSIT